jgi:amino acid adenylation domain-containing protein
VKHVTGLDQTYKQIAALSQEERELFELLLRKQGVDVSSLILPVERASQPLPLSFAQEQLWFLDQLHGGSPAYIVPLALRLAGSLNKTTLEQSLNEILRRHEALRTTFPAVDGRPVQVISQAATLTLEVVDLSRLPHAEREAQLRRLAIEEGRRLFDLVRGPLFRASLLRLADDEHALFLTTHHIVSDALSMVVLIQELAALCAAYATGKPSPLSPLFVQYADFAHWQRRWLQGDVLDSHLSYWRRKLGGDPPVLQLPTDRPRPAVQTFHGARRFLTLSRSLSEALRHLSRQEGVTLFMTLLAGFKTLLARYTGQDDILVGSPATNRNRTGIEGLIGFLVNVLVMRTDLSGDPSFRQLLSRVRDVALEAYAHQDMPFEKLVEELQPARDLSYNPLYQVMFTFVNAPLPHISLPGVTVTPLQVHNGTAKFDLLLELWDRPEGLSGALEYNTDLFDDTTIDRMTGHFQTLLESVVGRPEQSIWNLPILTPKERQQLLVDWNQTQRNFPQASIHELFEAQAALTPEATALVFEKQRLTYAELDRRSDQVAHYLSALGVGLETVVGICVERSLEMVVGLLGILKTGAAYLPLDPSYPKARLAFMLDDSRVPVLLTQRRLAGNLPEHGARLACLDEFEFPASEFPRIRSGATSENAAYMIYTSGSTGAPKGVLGLHGGAINRFHWMWETYPFDAGEVCCQKTSLSFVDSIWEIFGPLLRGIPNVLIPEDVVKHPLRLVQLLAENQVSRIVLVPSLLRILLDTYSDLGSRLPRLKYWVSSGETLPLELAQLFRERVPEGILLNLYGSSEVTADATWYDTRTNQSPSNVPIGRPIANMRVYLLDSHREPVPVGVTGEVYVGGRGLARGYFDRADLTAEKFILDPFRGDGERLYKTGDLARYLPDGNIEFLGRRDHQVELRGFRIELGEIETALTQHPDVRETVVLLREDTLGERRLVAYIVPRDEQSLTNPVLRRYLRTRLPEYMIPSAFVRLHALPLMPNGKVDRKSLPPLDRASYERDEPFVEARTPTEKVLAGIWAETFGLERVGIYDSFFELGGHSLQVMQMIAKISAATSLDVSVQSLFLHPTIADLAATLDLPQKAVAATISASGSEASSPIVVSPAVKVEDRPLLSLLEAKEIDRVDAAALIALPASFVDGLGVSREMVIREWCNNRPVWSGVLETHLGRIASIVLPRFSSDLYTDRAELVRLSIDALEMAGRLGARTVSLTGLIPSATDYGRAIADAMAGRPDLPAISTGHATTTAAVVMTIDNIAQRAGRDLSQEKVGFLGLGSIGLASLRLMLRCLPHPAKLILCDVYGQREMLERIQRNVVSRSNFRGAVQIVESRAEVAAEFYDATVMVGAANVAGILDVGRIKAGTLIVDDSAPHCFVPEQAARRLLEQEDILFTEGGTVRSPQPVQARIYVPRPLQRFMSAGRMGALANYNPLEITGCILSSVLTSRFEEFEPTVGAVDEKTSYRHYQALNRLGFQAAGLHCEGYVLTEESIRNFRHRFCGQMRSSF